MLGGGRAGKIQICWGGKLLEASFGDQDLSPIPPCPGWELLGIDTTLMSQECFQGTANTRDERGAVMGDTEHQRLI